MSDGVWLAEATATALCQLDLAPASRLRVLLVLVCESARRGGADARLGVADLAAATGLGRRTVIRSLADLKARGIVSRVGRYRRLRIALPAPRPGPSGVRATARKSRTTVEGGARKFSVRQQSLIEHVLAEITVLTGADAMDLPYGRSGITYGATYERLCRGAIPAALSAFVWALLGLVRSAEVQGFDLT